MVDPILTMCIIPILFQGNNKSHKLRRVAEHTFYGFALKHLEFKA